MTEDLRRRAEAKARQLGAAPPAPVRDLSPDESQRVLHDLRVHQIELEMQNDELRLTQERLEDSRARYFDLYDLAPVGYLTIEDHNLIVEANLTAATLLGVTRGTLVNQSITAYIAPQDQDGYYLYHRRLLATGVPGVIDLQMQRAGGEPFWARLEATTAQKADGHSEVCRVVMSDISERKRLEAERLRLERELQQAEKAESLGRMAAAIAHHFNNHLAVVMGNLELSLDGPRGDSKYLNNALRATRKAAELSRLLLTYLGQDSGSREALDLSELCRHTLPMLRAAIPDGVVVEADLPSSGPAVHGNQNQLQLLLTHLLTNAWEAGGDLKTPIRLTVKTVAPTDIPTGHRFATNWQPRSQYYACLEISDGGCGIEERDIEKIFEPFFTTKFIGRGLGLPITLGIVIAHSGVMLVETSRGPRSGTVFRVYLPGDERLEATTQDEDLKGRTTR
ncbi:MAG: ATP-binding protein [Acidobacteriota bacterium]